MTSRTHEQMALLLKSPIRHFQTIPPFTGTDQFGRVTIHALESVLWWDWKLLVLTPVLNRNNTILLAPMQSARDHTVQERTRLNPRTAGGLSHLRTAGGGGGRITALP